MNLGVTGIIINGFDQLVLIERNDTKTWAPPAGGMEIGELPTDAVIREVKEETGLKVMPVRLVMMEFRPFFGGRSVLHFTYRCLEAGGELTPSAESLQVGYFRTQQLPRKMFSFNREQIEEATSHTGKAIWLTKNLPWRLLPRWLWLKLVVYPRFDRQRKAKGEPLYVPPPAFKVSVAVAVRDEQNNLIWIQKDGVSRLPIGPAPSHQPPWESAAQLAQASLSWPVEISRLVAVYIDKESAEALILWEATTSGTDGLADIPANADEQSARFAQEALEDNDLVTTDWL